MNVNRITHRTLGPQPSVTLVTTICRSFLLSLSMMLSRPTSDPFSPDTRITITHELYCLADSFVLTTHFISDSLLFCLTTPSELFSPHSWLTCTNMVRALVSRVVYIVYGLVLYSLALISLERPSSPTALQTRTLSKIIRSSYLSHPDNCSLPTHLHHPHLGPIPAVNRLERSLGPTSRSTASLLCD